MHHMWPPESGRPATNLVDYELAMVGSLERAGVIQREIRAKKPERFGQFRRFFGDLGVR
jgi:hypothetical protein